MKATVNELAEILIPNKEHKSFSGSNMFIDQGTKLDGTPTVVNGQRRGKPFDYKLFKTDSDQYIYLNKIKIYFK